MAQLSTIIGSILHDMVYAQHQANMYASSLEEAYRKSGRLEQFAMPAIALGEMELTVRYGITNTDKDTEQFEVNYPVLRNNIRHICRAGAKLLIRNALPILNDILKNTPKTGDARIGELEVNPELKRKLSAFLSHQIYYAIQNDPIAITNDDGTINNVAISNIYIHICEEFLLHHEEIEEIISRYKDENIVEIVINAVRDASELEVPAIVAGMNNKRKRIMPSIDVAVGTDELNKLPEEAIHTLHLKVSPQIINLYAKE